MKRPLGIVFCSVFLSLAASVFLLLATLTISSTSTARQLLPAVATLPSITYNILAIGIYLGLATFLILTVIGILRLRAWARYSVLVIGGIIAAVGLFSIFTLVISHTSAPQLNTDSHEQQFVWIMGLANGLVACVGLSWLIYFNRHDTRELFRNPPTNNSADRNLRPFPTSIKVLGCLFLFSTLCCLIFGFLPLPGFLFEFILSAKTAHFLNLTIAILWGLAGYGLLRLKEPARLLAIAILLLSCCNLLLATLPWYQSHYRQYMVRCMTAFPASSDGLASLIASILFGLIINLFVLWLLHRHRAAFTPPPTTLETA